VDWDVVSLTLIPSFCIPVSAIEQRPPLGPNARRAGWIGCNIILDQVPEKAKPNLVISGKADLPENIRAAFTHIQPLNKLEIRSRGWTLDILNVIQKLPNKSFSVTDVYAYEVILARKHPDNNNVRPKIRQQLQILRDMGLISFLGKGSYKVEGNSN
jgi:type II restriction enzyme